MTPVTEHCVRVCRGSIYLERKLCELYFPGVSSVAAMVRNGQVLLLPLRRSAAGGLLLKVRNARGDRVVHVDELLRTLGISNTDAERFVPVRWDCAAACLRLDEL